jgi:hypothetical protein
MTSAPIYQTRWSHPETVWGDVSKDVYDKYETFGYVERRIVYLESPAPIASASEAVAEVESWTNGSYHRNYKLRWLKDVEAGAKLYAAAQPSRAEVLPGAFDALRHVVATLRETGRFIDEEGESTNALESLLPEKAHAKD